MSKVTVARAVFELETVKDSALFSASVKLSSRLNTLSDASSLTDMSAIGNAVSYTHLTLPTILRV